MIPILTILLATATVVGGIILLIYAYRMRYTATRMLGEAQAKWESAKKEIEAEKREALLRLKDELYGALSNEA